MGKGILWGFLTRPPKDNLNDKDFYQYNIWELDIFCINIGFWFCRRVAAKELFLQVDLHIGNLTHQFIDDGTLRGDKWRELVDTLVKPKKK